MNWGKISDFSKHMKGFAKDLMTVDDDDDDPFQLNKEVNKELKSYPKQADPKIEHQSNDNDDLINNITAQLNELQSSQLQQDFNDLIQSIRTREQEQNRQLQHLQGTLLQHSKKLADAYQQIEELAMKLKYINKIIQSTFNLQEEEITQESLTRAIRQSGEMLQLQKKLVDAQDRATSFQMELQERESKSKNYQKWANDWDKNKREFIEEIKIRSQENDQLKQKLKQREQELSQLQKELQMYQNEMKKFDEIKNEKDEEIDRLSLMLEEWQQENQHLQQGIQNIQIMNEQEQIQKTLLVNKYEEQLKKLRFELEQQWNKLNQFDQVDAENNEMRKQLNKINKQFDDINCQYQICVKENNDQQIQISALQKKIKNDQLNQNDIIDKRIITQFLVNYFDVNTEYQVKMQILETLSSMLNFNEEEKAKIGK